MNNNNLDASDATPESLEGRRNDLLPPAPRRHGMDTAYD